MKLISLKTKLNRQAILILATSSVAIGLSIVVFLNYQQKVNTQTAVNELVASGRIQSDQLLSMFLVPEQQQGSSLLLDRIIQNEGLTAATVLLPNESSPTGFEDCALTSKVQSCVSTIDSSIGVFFPLVESEHLYGYLFKSKRANSLISQTQSHFLITVFLVSLVFISLFLIIGITRITAKEIPEALNELVTWIDRQTEVSPQDATHPLPNLKFEELEWLAKRIHTIIAEKQMVRDQAKLGELSAQIAHDIRSPLTALEMVTFDLSSMDEDRRTLTRRAVNRIKDIANGLIEVQRESLRNQNGRLDQLLVSGAPKNEFLPAILESIVTEKRMQFRDKPNIEIDFRIDHSGLGASVLVQSVEFGRIISNLINNSVEAMSTSGKVEVALSKKNDFVVIEVSDDGCGISEDILPLLTVRGATFNKKNGSGLGLHHARKSIEAWLGKFSIRSVPSEGTVVRIELPAVAAPSWFLEKLSLPTEGFILVLDDDPSVHQVWKSRFSSLQPQLKNQVEVHYFSRCREAEIWISSKKETDKIVCLVDYELLGDETGLEFLRRTRMQANGVLVSSRFEEESVRAECEAMGVKIIPKSHVTLLPIQIVEQPVTDLAGILIDDDELVRITWSMRALETNRKILTFESYESFKNSVVTFDSSVPIYVDVNLGDGVQGEAVGEDLWKKGFSKIFLATGYDADKFRKSEWLSGVLGKDPPF